MGGSSGCSGPMATAKTAVETTNNRSWTLSGIAIKKITIAINSEYDATTIAA
jgi:hypothetical protein